MIAEIVNHVVSLALSTVLFAMIYRFMPRVKVEWHDVWIGAFVTAVLFEVGKFAIGPLHRQECSRVGLRRRGLRSSCCWCGCTTPRRSSCSAPSSRGSTSARTARRRRARRSRTCSARAAPRRLPHPAAASPLPRRARPSPNGLQADGPYIPVEPVATDRPVGIAFVAGLVAGVMVFVRPVRNLVLDATFGRKFATDIDARIESWLRGR